MLMFFSDLAWQPFLVDLGLPTASLGIVFSIIGLLSAVVPLLSSYLKKYSLKKILIIETIILMCLFLGVATLMPPHFVLATLFFIFLNAGSLISDPLLSEYKHRLISESVRATVGSIERMFMAALIGLFTLLAGFFLDIFPARFVIASGFIFGIIAIYFYSKLSFKKSFSATS